MDLYVVTREGVYRHEILGIFKYCENAMTRAKLVLDEEPDDYHGIMISKAILDEPIIDTEELIIIRK